jgi:cytochrome b561
MSLKSTPRHYGMVAVTLHWTIAGLVLVALASGFAADTIGETARNPLRVHVAAGFSAGLLTLVRIAWWWFADTRPDAAPNTEGLQGMASRVVHILLILIPVGMLASGIGMMILSGAGGQLFAGAPGPLPDFDRFLPRGPHGAGAFALLALLVLHVAAALYHQYFLRDRLFERMRP